MNKFQPKTLFIGKNTVYLPTCHSTNETATEIIQKKEILEGTIVITDNQTKGKGQRGNTWIAEPNKNLTFTIILKPSFMTVSEQFTLNIAISIGLHKALRNYLDEDLKIKWPNDVFYGDKKVGGILIESIVSNKKMNYCFVGIGININQTDFELPNASSISNICQKGNLDINEILEKICEGIEEEYDELRAGKIEYQKENYINRLYRFDEWHLFKDKDGSFDGKIIGITPSGKLIMETKLGLKQFETKEFEYIY
jgi:BirA family transcriptional regulator, biotin operon repressor / biotin---[acetyl-CoA-carboxylase] ligase